MLKKVFALIIAVSLTVSSFPVSSFSAPTPYFNVDNITSLASITEASFKNSDVSVFNIQDLHFHIDAQKKICSLLEKLNTAYPQLELYVEGASQNSDFEWVYSGLGKKNGDVFLDALFNSGNMSGAEYFAAKHGKKINPLEDKSVFDRNLLLFSELIEERPAINALISPLETSLESLRNKYFTREQKNIFRAYKDYRSGTLSDGEYLNILKKTSIENNVDINEYPNIVLYSLADGAVYGVNQKKLQAQMASLFSNLKNILSYKQYSELTAVTDNLKDRQKLISYLYKNREKVNLKDYPELNKFIVSLVLSDKLNRLEFITEENTLFAQTLSKMSSDKNSSNIVFMSRFSDIYKNVLMTSVTSDEYKYFKNKRYEFKNLLLSYLSADGLDSLNGYETKAVEFNDTNILRNEIFIEHILGESFLPLGIHPDTLFGVQANAEAVFKNSTKSKVKVIVAGGFHTDGINELLNKRRVNNVTFMPKINSSGGDFSQKYVEYTRALRSASSSAIPLATFNELPSEILIERTLDAFADKNSGLDLSLPAVKEAVETFLSSRKDISEVRFSYNEETGKASISYTDSNGNKKTLSDKTETNLTSLGEIDVDFVKKALDTVLKSSLFWDSEPVVMWLCARIMGKSDILFEKEPTEEELKQALISKTFDLEKLFAVDRKVLSDFVVYLFSHTPVTLKEDSKQKRILEKIESSLKEHFSKKSVISVKVSDNPLLLNDEDDWCFGAFRTQTDKTGRKERELYIHSVFLDALAGLDDATADVYIQAFIQHELYEYAALYDTSSNIYADFTRYLERINNLTEEESFARNSHNFHNYLIKSNFQEKVSYPKEAERQKVLLSFAERKLNEYLSRQAPIGAIKKIKSVLQSELSDEDKKDLALLRIGEENVINKYVDKLAEHIRDNIMQSSDKKDEYVIAFRKTHPQHIIEDIAGKVARKLDVKIVLIEQDSYMNTVPLRGHREAKELRGRLEIVSAGKENVLSEEEIVSKNIILIEDTCKTGVLFAEMARVLNKAKAKEVFPLAIFDLREAVISQSKEERGEKIKDFGHIYDVNVHLVEFAFNFPQRFAEIIKNNEDNISKYAISALAKLNSETPDGKEKLDIILKEFESAGIMDKILENLMDAQSTSANSAANIIPLIHKIYQMTYNKDDKYKDPDKSFIDWIQKKYVPKTKEDKDKGILSIDDVSKWEKPYFIAVYAALKGYGKIDVFFEKTNEKEEEQFSQAAKQFQISFIKTKNSAEDYQDSKITAQEKEMLDVIIPAIEDDINRAKERFIQNLNNKKIENPEQIYADEIKEIVKKVERKVHYILQNSLSRKMRISQSDYSIVIGGSLVNASATPSSDLYYGIISKDKGVSDIMRENFVPLFEYIFEHSGIEPYYSGESLGTYINSKKELADEFSFLNGGISDDRAIAAFFDFVPLHKKDNPLFDIYLNHYLKRLANTKGRNKIYEDIQNQMRHILSGYAGLSAPSDEGENISVFATKGLNKKGKYQEIYDIAFRQNGEIFENGNYEWFLSETEILLKNKILTAIKNEKVPAEFILKVREQRSTDNLIDLLADNGILDAKTAGELKSSWMTVRDAFRNKEAKKSEEDREEIFTQAESVDEIESLKVLKKFIDEEIKELNKAIEFSDSEKENSQETLFTQALNFAANNFDDVRYRQALERLEQYKEMYGENADGIMYAVVLLSDLKVQTDEKGNETDEFKDLEDFFAESFKGTRYIQAKYITDRIKRLQRIINLPSYNSLASGFTIQNYVNMIIAYISDYTSDTANFINALFADRTQHLIYLSEAKSRNERLKDSLEELKKENKLRFEEAEKTNESEGYKEDIQREIDKNTEEIDALDKKIERQKEELENATKLFYAIYVHLAGKIGFSAGFDILRNTPFIKNNSTDYINLRNDLRVRLFNSDTKESLEYDDLEGKLNELAAALRKHFKSQKLDIKEHHRVKSMYSIFEKIQGKRRGKKRSKNYKNIKADVRKKTALIKDGVERDYKDIERISEIIDNLHDLIGFHIVVKNRDERNAVMAEIEKFFESKEAEALGFSLNKDYHDNYDSEADKGFTRYKYQFKYHGDALGEVVVFSQEQYINELFSVVPGGFRQLPTRFSTSHIIYKLGEMLKYKKKSGKKDEDKDEDEKGKEETFASERYSDRFITVKMDFEHFGIKDKKRKEAVFYNDSVELNGNPLNAVDLNDNIRKINGNIIKEEEAALQMKTEERLIRDAVSTNFIIVNDTEENLTYIPALPTGSIVFDVLSAVKFDRPKDGGYYALFKEGTEEELDWGEPLSEREMARYYIKFVQGKPDWSRLENISPKTIRGRLIKFKGGEIKNKSYPDYIEIEKRGKRKGRIKDEETEENVELFAKHLGLSGVDELFAVIEMEESGEEAINTKRRTVDGRDIEVNNIKKMLEEFLNKRKQYVIEIQTSNIQDSQHTDITGEILKNAIYTAYNTDPSNSDYKIDLVSDTEWISDKAELEPDKNQAGFKILFTSKNGEDALKHFEERIHTFFAESPELVSSYGDTTVTSNEFEGFSFKYAPLADNTTFLGSVRALGAKVNELIENAQIYSVDAASAIIKLFEKKTAKIKQSDENLQAMQFAVIKELKKYLKSQNPKYGGYEYNLVLSENRELISSAHSYAFAAMNVEEEKINSDNTTEGFGKITLYINKTFFDALSTMSDNEAEFYLKQLAVHEGGEYLAMIESKIKGETFSYEQYHKTLETNPDQLKLMEFAADIAQSEILSRTRKNIREIAESAALKLTAFDEEPDYENPADFILLCGNDEPATFDKTIELYRRGAVKQIVVAGGAGRLTLPLIKKALELNTEITLSDGSIIRTKEDVSRLENLPYTELKKLITEADIIESVLLNKAKSQGLTEGLNILKEDESSNTRENFDNEIIRRKIEEIKSSNDGKPIRFAYIQTPMQQLRTKFVFNSVFKKEISAGDIEGISVSVSDFYKNMTDENIIRSVAGELLRIIVYSLKGDTLPSINNHGFVFDGAVDVDFIMQVNALLESFSDKKALRQELISIVNNTKDSFGNDLFEGKESILNVLSDKMSPELFAATKDFLDFVYYDYSADDENAYKELARKAFENSRFFSALPFSLQKTAIRSGSVPEYLNNPYRAFVFDIDNASSDADLIAYAGSFKAKAFALTRKRYISPEEADFLLPISADGRNIVIRAALKKTQTENGIFYDVQYYVPDISDSSTAISDKTAAEAVRFSVFENKEITEKLKSLGLDLFGISENEIFFIENLPENKDSLTLNSLAELAVSEAAVALETVNAERKAQKKGLFNEKLAVSAMYKGVNDSGIGEITSLPDYSKTVLNPAGVNGFTIYDLSVDENPFAVNYLLLDWTAVPEAAGIKDIADIYAPIAERENIDRANVALKKNLIAVKVFENLSSQQLREVEVYASQNASWLNSFADSQREKYNIDADKDIFRKVIAMQQIFVERQLRESISKMSDMKISMYLKGLDASNGAQAIMQWMQRGIMSFTVEQEVTDFGVLKEISQSVAKTGLFADIAVKSFDMTKENAKILAEAGYAPIVSFDDINNYDNLSGYRVELDDKTFKRSGYGIENLLKESALSGAYSVDYPIGLLWNEVVSEDAVKNYRIPAKGSRRFGGINLGLFSLGQRTFEESYAGTYVNAVEIGENIDVKNISFDINASVQKKTEINGVSLPATYAAVFIGSLAKQNRLSEIKDFEETVQSLITALGADKKLIERFLKDYRAAHGEQKEIHAAKIAGFLQGLNKKIILNGKNFTSKGIADIYAVLTAEASLFKAGYYPAGYDEDAPIENYLSKIENILALRSLSDAATEIEPILLNFSVPIRSGGFTFNELSLGEIKEDKEKSQKAYGVYSRINEYILDIFIDRAALKEQIRKTSVISSIDAVRSIMASA